MPREIGMALVKIVSGGQTGVDRAALDAALAVGFPCGGWCPADRSAEDGPIPEKYPMSLLAALCHMDVATDGVGAVSRSRAADSPSPGEDRGIRTARQVGGQRRQRTLKNVQDSDGTAILFNQSLTGGTKLTRDMCIHEKKPFIVLDATQITAERAVAAVLRFIQENEIQTLNVAGPRASGWPRAYEFALAVVSGVIENRVDR
jgi:Circularly permutated YpsA SLOG family